ncbi:MAG: TRAP transporter small permease subunit [Burkholderiales bacterium]
MRKIADAYYLNILLVVAVVALLVPVTLQMISARPGSFPAWIWTEEMARFFFIWLVMIGAMIGVREGTHFEVDVWPKMGARQRGTGPRLDGVRADLGADLRVVRHQVRAGAGWNQTSEFRRFADGLDLRGVAARGVTWLVFGLPRLRADIRILIYGSTPHDVAVARDVGTGSLI